MAGINVGGQYINLTSIRPSGRSIQISGHGQTYYGVLSTSKPGYRTLNFRNGGQNYYLVKAGKLVTSVKISWYFNNGRGTSSSARIKEIYVYDSGGQDVTGHFNFREHKQPNNKASIKGDWRNLIDRNLNTEVYGYCHTSNDGQARYTVWLENGSGVYIKRLRVVFGNYSDSSEHDGHETYIDINGTQVWRTTHQSGYLEFDRSWEN